MEVARPQHIPNVNKLEPPYDIKGNGKPTIGIKPITMLILINVCQKKMLIKPITTMASNNLVTLLASHKKRKNKIK